MALTATRSINIVFAGDQVANNTYPAATNSSTPADSDIVTLAVGFNLLTPPTGGKTPKGFTLIPPAGNTSAMTLKGVTGDTGFLLHLTDPTSIGLGSPTGTFGITVATADIVGARIIWT